MLATPNSLASVVDTPSSSSSPLEGEEKRWGISMGRPCFLAEIPKVLRKLIFQIARYYKFGFWILDFGIWNL